MMRAPLRIGARFSSTRIPSNAVDAAPSAFSTAFRIEVSAAGSRSTTTGGGGCFCAASVSSIRATASSTMRVSELRLRLAYSSRNQRPRAVSMKASRIAS